MKENYATNVTNGTCSNNLSHQFLKKLSNCLLKGILSGNKIPDEIHFNDRPCLRMPRISWEKWGQSLQNILRAIAFSVKLLRLSLLASISIQHIIIISISE